MKRWWLVFSLFAALSLLTPGLAADTGIGPKKDKDLGQNASKKKGKPQGQKDIDKKTVRDQEKDQIRDRDRNRDFEQGWERRDGFEYRTYGERDTRPPGWNGGKKTGWKNCGVPPGHAKKGECRTYSYQGRRYYYYRNDDGSLIFRRPAVEPKR